MSVLLSDTPVLFIFYPALSLAFTIALNMLLTVTCESDLHVAIVSRRGSGLRCNLERRRPKTIHCIICVTMQAGCARMSAIRLVAVSHVIHYNRLYTTALTAIDPTSAGNYYYGIMTQHMSGARSTRASK